MSSSPKLVGFGNPLLDISAHVGQDMLDKYDLKAGIAILAEPKHLPLYGELIEKFPVEYIAGGACQNSMRAAAWMLQKGGEVAYVGCVGSDENAKTLRNTAEKAGVQIHYCVTESKPTGACAVLIRERERSLIANLGAAETYRAEHFQSKEITDLLKGATHIYGEGFFITHSSHILLELGKFAAANNKTYFINLSAPFVVQFFLEKLKEILPWTDGVICNEDEATALAQKMGWEGLSLDEVASRLANTPKVNTSQERMVIFTQGSKQTIVYTQGKVHHFHPTKLAASEIVDTNGAGDSFAGGFLSRFIQGKSLEESIAAGHYCAMECIKRSGATYPETFKFQFP